MRVVLCCWKCERTTCSDFWLILLRNSGIFCCFLYSKFPMLQWWKHPCVNNDNRVVACVVNTIRSCISCTLGHWILSFCQQFKAKGHSKNRWSIYSSFWPQFWTISCETGWVTDCSLISGSPLVAVEEGLQQILLLGMAQPALNANLNQESLLRHWRQLTSINVRTPYA